MDQESLQKEPAFTSGEEYGQLLKPENFSAQAEDIFLTIKEAIETGQPKSEAYKKAEVYIADEENPQLQNLAKVILGAPRAIINQQRLDQIRQEIKQQGRTPELKAKEKDSKHIATLYNHMIRGLIFENPDMFTRDQLENWLERGSGGNAVWARQQISGMAAEVAAARVLQNMAGISGVRLSEIDEDLRGVDLVATKANGEEVKFDIKYGGHRPDNDNESLGDKEVVGIDPKWVEGFSIIPDYQPDVRASFADTLT